MALLPFVQGFPDAFKAGRHGVIFHWFDQVVRDMIDNCCPGIFKILIGAEKDDDDIFVFQFLRQFDTGHDRHLDIGHNDIHLWVGIDIFQGFFPIGKGSNDFKAEVVPGKKMNDPFQNTGFIIYDDYLIHTRFLTCKVILR